MQPESESIAPASTTWSDDFRQRARRSWRILWRGKFLILACLALALVPVILFLQQTTPRYTAETRIMIEAPEVNDPLADRAINRPRLSDAVVQTEAELITSTILARRVVEKLRLDQDPEFNVKLREPKPLAVFLASLNPKSWIPEEWRSKGDELSKLPATARAEVERAAVLRALIARLKVRVQRRSFIISVQFTSESREKAALIANTVAELYVLDRLEASFEDAHRVTGWLGERLESLRRDVAAAEGAVEEYRSRHGLRRKGERQATVTDQQLSELTSRLMLARADLAQKQARLSQARGLVQSRGTVETSSDVLQSQLIQRLREQEAVKSREMSEALKTYGDRHPRMLGLRADLGELHGKIAGETGKIATSIANEVEVAAAGVSSLERQLDSLRLQSNTAGEAEVRLRELERQADASRGLYEAFLARFKREGESERMQRANARVVSPAFIPIMPSYPPSPFILTFAAALALTVGCGLAFLLDWLDNAVRSSDEAEELSGLPTLAMVPLHRRAANRLIEEVIQRPRSPLADAVRSMRTALDPGEETGAGRVVLITSSIPKEGKTFVSLCLALLFSQTGERILLIDGDVHRPRLHSAIGVEGERGLAQVLAGEAAPEEVIVPVAEGAVDFLPAGRYPHIAELIKAPRMEALIADLGRRYDRIVIDSPPVLAVADTRVLARLADRVIYLVKWNSTPRDAVRNGLKLLHGSGVTVFGLVLSQVNQRKHARYGYGDYGQYYGRYREYYGE